MLELIIIEIYSLITIQKQNSSILLLMGKKYQNDISIS